MLTFNGSILKKDSAWLNTKSTLPEGTIRFRFWNNYTPTSGTDSSNTSKFGVWTAVDASQGIWDWTCNDRTSWLNAFENRLTQANMGNRYCRILEANFGSVTSARQMFKNCTRLESVENTHLTNVTTAYYMFYGAANIRKAEIYDTSKLTNAAYMFAYIYSLTSVTLFDTSHVTDFGSMFYTCYGLTSVPAFNTSNGTKFDYFLGACTSLTSIPLFDTSNAVDMQYMCYNCTSLTSIPLFDTSSCSNMNSAFSYCERVETGALDLYNQASSQTVPPSSHNATFNNCGFRTVSGAAELAQIPQSWGGTMA